MLVWSGATACLISGPMLWFSVWCPGNGSCTGALTIWSGGGPAQLCDVVCSEIIFSTPTHAHTQGWLDSVWNMFIVHNMQMSSVDIVIEEEKKAEHEQIWDYV